MTLTLLGAFVACGPLPPEPTLTIEPALPTTVDDLVAFFDGVEGGAVVRWTRDGVAAGEGARVAAERTERGQRWTAELVVEGEVRAHAGVVVGNAAPVLTIEVPAEVVDATAFEAVVTAEDPDGDAVRLTWTWTLDGAEQVGLGMRVHEDRVRAGQAWTVVVRGDDGSDVTDVTAGPVRVRRRGSALFESAHPAHLTLELEADALDDLLEDPEDWVHADLRWNGRRLDDVGVRLKGRGSFAPIGERASFRIETARYVPGQTLDGISEFALNNMGSDPTLVRERLAYTFFGAVGVPAPRAATVKLTVNGDVLGPYTMVDHVDPTFLRHTFGDGDGPLFEMEGSELDPPGIDALDHDGGRDERATLRALAELLDDPVASLSGAGADLIDVAAWARFLAACGIVGHYDGYPFHTPGDDLYLYVDPADGRIRFVAHGADEAFQDGERPVDYVLGELGQRCLREGPCRATYLDALHEMLDHAEAMDLLGLADDAIDEVEPLTWARWMTTTLEEREAARDDLRTFLRERRSDIEAMIILE